MVTIAFNAGVQPHFASFLAPLYNGLPERYRGTFYARQRAHSRARDFGIWAENTRITPSDRRKPIVVASHEDYRAVRPGPVVMVNHGIGQTYWADGPGSKGYRHPSYSGGTDRERIVMNLCPSFRDADLNARYYPDALSVACGPWRLDPWLLGRHKRAESTDLVVLSFHHDCHISPETRWAFPFYKKVISDIAASGRFNLAGHGHPRFQSHLKAEWKQMGIPFIEDFDEVLDRASVYVCDNSSSQYETAAIGIPNVVLNCPEYRKDANHGLRFWSAVPGVQVDTPANLYIAINEALHRPASHQAILDAALQQVYDGGVLDGQATSRAVDALIDLAETWDGS